MIKVDRTKVSEPPILFSNNSHSEGEKQLAILFNEQGVGEKVDFKIYRTSGVKDALETLFRKKCAYCESIVKHVDYFHIEHWRPKGRVTEAESHKGYYWLASEWDNLLLACGVCNGAANKGNRFPLQAGSTYAFNSTEEHDLLEKPLLINPCDIDPSEHFTYNRYGVILGKEDQGETSIEVYGLRRLDLTAERMKWAEVVIEYLDDILFYISQASKNIEQEKKFHVKINNKISTLEIYISPDFQYSAMNRFLVLQFKNEHSSNVILNRKLGKILI